MKNTEITNTEKDITIETNPSETQVKEWTEKYGELKKIEVSDGEHTHIFYAKRTYPNKRQTISLANKKLMETRDIQQYAEIVLRNAIVNGWGVIANDDDIFLALVPQAEKLVSKYVVHLGE
jgi:hypothetical protein